MISKVNNDLQLGLCYGSSFEAHYSWTGLFSKDTEIYRFSGFENTLLQYDPEESAWILFSYSNPLRYAMFNGSSTYPFGTQKWFFFNDTCDPDEYNGSELIDATKKIYKLTLNFNACHTFSEFNCGDGSW